MNKDPKKQNLAERFKALPPDAKQKVLEALNQLREERATEVFKQKARKDLLEKYKKKDEDSQ